MMRINRQDKGFTLIELLIVVAIIGILAAIAIPNLLTAMQRSKQKRTMADIRSIATSWEAYATDANAYSQAAQDVQTYTWPTTTLSYGSLSALLSPTYIRNLPQLDGWSQDYEYGLDRASLAQEYAIRSLGKDGAAQTGAYNLGATEYFECDIVYSMGSFLVFPEGTQRGTTN